jgi:hypothetical protein
MTLNASGRLLLNKTDDDGVNQFQCAGGGKFSGGCVSTEFKTDKATVGTAGGEGSGFQMSDYTNNRHARFELGSDNKVRLFVLISGSWSQQAVWG